MNARVITLVAATAALAAIASAATSGNGCPADWKQYKDEKCLLYNNVSVNFAAAEHICHKLASSSLVAINSVEENMFVMSLILNHIKDRSVPEGVWLSLHRQPNSSNSSSWFWTHGAPLDYETWHDGCPTADSSKGCAVTLTYPERYVPLWYDVDCDKGQYHVVCEKPLVKPTNELEAKSPEPSEKSSSLMSAVVNEPSADAPVVDTGRCNPGWSFYADKCYKLHPRTFSSAKSIDFECWNSYAAHAANISSDGQQKFVERLVFEEDKAERPVIIAQPKGTYGHWASGEPSPIQSGSDKCVILDNKNETRGQWRVVSCDSDSEYRVLCAKNARKSDTSTNFVPLIAAASVPNQSSEVTKSMDIVTEANVVKPTAAAQSDDKVPSDDDQDGASPQEVAEDVPEEIEQAGILVVLFVIAALVICFVLLFAYRLRKKAQMIALQSSRFDSQTYFDKRDQSEKDTGDLILFEKKNIAEKL